MLLLISRLSIRPQCLNLSQQKYFFLCDVPSIHLFGVLKSPQRKVTFLWLLAMLHRQCCHACKRSRISFSVATPSPLPSGSAGPSTERGWGGDPCLLLWVWIRPWLRLPGFQVLSGNYEWAGLSTSLGRPNSNFPISYLCTDPVPVVCVFIYSFFNVGNTEFG